MLAASKGVCVDPNPQLPEFPARYQETPEILGSGGFATVFKVLDSATGRPVAAKVLQRQTYDEAFGSAFNAEVRAAARLQHPGVVQLLDTGLTKQGQPFLVMEYADGGSFKRICEEPPPWLQLRDLFVELLDTLAFVHARGILHRDIKPENLLLAHDEHGQRQLKLADLGIARLSEMTGKHVDEDSTRGTPTYMAPEQMEGQGRWLGPWTDLYAVGCVLYEALAATPTFSGNPWALMYRKLADGPPPLPIRKGYAVPPGIGAVVAHMLARPPDARYALAADARDALLALGDAEPPPPPPPESDLPTGRPNLFGDAPALLHVHHPALPEYPPDDPRTRQSAGTSPEMFLLRRPPLVDREGPRESLWRLVRSCDDERTPRVAVLAGEAGVGKGRLAQWLHESLQRDGRFQTIYVDHDPEPGSVGAGINGAMRRFLAFNESDDAGLRQTVERYLQRHEGNTREEADALIGWLGTSSEARAMAAPDLQERAALLHRALKRASAGGGALVWFNEVQWSRDGATFRVLRDLLLQLQLEPLPVLLLVTVRTEEPSESSTVRDEVERLRERQETTWIPVERLGLEDGRQLLQELLLLEDRLAERVWERGAGNPLFAVQIVASWLADGLLEEKLPLRWGLKSGVDEAQSLPESVEILSRNRIDGTLRRAPDETMAREVLFAAALVGGPMNRNAVTAVLQARGIQDDAGARRAWTHLHGEGLLVGRQGETRLDNPLLRETVLRDIADRDDARDFHRACAEGLRDWSRQTGIDLRGEIAEHLLAAGLPTEALRDLLPAAKSAETSDVYRAIRLYRAALRALDDLGADDGDRRRVQVLFGLGYTAELLGDLEHARNYLEDSLERCSEVVDGASIRCVLAEVLGMAGHLNQALALTDEALQLLDTIEDSPDTSRCRARAQRDRAEVLVNRGEPAEAELFFSRAIRTAEASGIADEVLNSRWKLARTERQLGNFKQARAGFEKALDESRQQRDRRVESICLRELGNVALIGGDLGRARELYEQSHALNKIGGHELERLTTENSLAELARQEGDLETARSGYGSALAIAQAHNLLVESAVALGNLGFTSLAAGDGPGALQSVDRMAVLLADEPRHWLSPYRMVIEVAGAAAIEDWDRYQRAAAEIATHDLARAPDPDLATWLEFAAKRREDAGRDSGELRTTAKRVLDALNASIEKSRG